MFKRRLAFIVALLLACSTFSPSVTRSKEGYRGATQQGQNSAVTATPETLAPQTTENASGFEVRLHPEDGIYIGELVSFEILAPDGIELAGQEIEIHLNDPDETVLGPAQFHLFGIGGRSQATFLWEWDTSAFIPGDYALTFNILPDGESWTETVTLLPSEQMPEQTANAEWAQVEIGCCIVYYMQGTEAERDINLLTEEIDEQAELAEAALGIELGGPISFVLMPRLLGHGGFASNEIYISYLDRNYAGESTSQVSHHEIIHILDAHLGGDLRPSMLVEGLAVYLSDGHFKVEPLMPRAAALLELEWFIPFETLTDSFYVQQHEVGYIQAGALTEYMVERWGWEAYNAFYRDLHRHPSGSEYQAIDEGLRRRFAITFAELEEDFRNALQTQPLDIKHVEDVRLTVAFFDSVRRYQQLLDPSAYFLTAWLLDIDEMQEYDVTADYLRHPDEAANIALETLLVAADDNLRAGLYAEADRLINAVNAVLDAIERGEVQPFGAHSLASHYHQLVLTLLDQGYEPHEIAVFKNTAHATVSRDGVNLVTLTLSLNGESWHFD